MAKSEAERQSDAERELEQRKNEAEAAEQEQKETAKAEAKREREREKAQNLKSQPDDADAPSQRVRGGDTAYSRDRLINESDAFLGQPSHVVAGALHDSEQEYVTLDDAQKAIKSFLGSQD